MTWRTYKSHQEIDEQIAREQKEERRYAGVIRKDVDTPTGPMSQSLQQRAQELKINLRDLWELLAIVLDFLWGQAVHLDEEGTWTEKVPVSKPSREWQEAYDGTPDGTEHLQHMLKYWAEDRVLKQLQDVEDSRNGTLPEYRMEKRSGQGYTELRLPHNLNRPHEAHYEKYWVTQHVIQFRGRTIIISCVPSTEEQDGYTEVGCTGWAWLYANDRVGYGKDMREALEDYEMITRLPSPPWVFSRQLPREGFMNAAKTHTVGEFEALKHPRGIAWMFQFTFWFWYGIQINMEEYQHVLTELNRFMPSEYHEGEGDRGQDAKDWNWRKLGEKYAEERPRSSPGKQLDEGAIPRLQLLVLIQVAHAQERHEKLEVKNLQLLQTGNRLSNAVLRFRHLPGLRTWEEALRKWNVHFNLGS